MTGVARPGLFVVGIAVALALALAGCGDEDGSDGGTQAATEEAPTTAGAPTSTSTTASAARTHSADFTSTDGYRYRIVVALGENGDCQAPPSAGRSSLPLTLTVTNQSADRPAPFPPLRIELRNEVTGGEVRERVLVRDPSGTCTFTPRVSSIAAGASVTFAGATPPLPDGAAPGSAGRIEVAVSESSFSLAAPVP